MRALSSINITVMYFIPLQQSDSQIVPIPQHLRSFIPPSTSANGPSVLSSLRSFASPLRLLFLAFAKAGAQSRRPHGLLIHQLCTTTRLNNPNNPNNPNNNHHHTNHQNQRPLGSAVS